MGARVPATGIATAPRRAHGLNYQPRFVVRQVGEGNDVEEIERDRRWKRDLADVAGRSERQQEEGKQS